MDFNIEETFEVFIAVAILTVAIIMVISASPLNYLHHHIKENPSLLIYHLGGQILYRSRTVLYNIFFVLSRFMPRRLWGDLFRPKLLKRPFFGLKDVYHFVVYNAYNTELYLQINAKMTLLLQITKFASQTASSWRFQPSYLSW